jgi:hypothetical protein
MSSFLQSEFGVAMSGVKWDIGNFKLWQSTQPDTILFTPRQPVLAKGENGRYQIAVSSYRQQADGTYKITGGSAIFTITSALQYDARKFQQLQDQWRAEMGPTAPRNPKFVPLNVQKGEAQVLINPVSGKPDEAHNNKDVGTPGGTNSFLVELTDLGAQEWAQGIKNKTAIPAGVKFMYEYLRLMPTVGAAVTVHGSRVFQHLSAALDVSVQGVYYGGSAKIEAAWEDMTRKGDVEVTFFGQMPPELESIRTEMVTTFSNQAREQLFKSLFEPKPDIKPAEPGKTSGAFGGANFALKWRRESETTDLSLTLKFEGWTWLKASMDADLTTLFAELDPSYVTEVQTEQSFPASIVVDTDPMLSNVATTINFAPAGHSPEAPVFGAAGGNERFTVTAQNPNDVKVSYSAQVSFTPSKWPVIQTSGTGTVAQGGQQILLKPSAWIGRHMIYMFVRDGNRIKSSTELTENDYLILNVSYNGPHLPKPINDSGRMTPLEPIEFSYPLDPQGRPGQAKFSAFGVIDGQLVRSKEQPINFDEEAVFVLAGRDGISLVSQASVIGETDDLAQRLKEAGKRGARPYVSGSSAEETGKANSGAGIGVQPQPGQKEITGRVVGAESGLYGPALFVQSNEGSLARVMMRGPVDLDRFDDTSKFVRILLDETGKYADRIIVVLGGGV